VKGLLHTNKSSISHESGMYEKFSSFFNEKINKAKASLVVESTTRVNLGVFAEASVNEVLKTSE
jgi:hypothetical protein